MRALRRLLGPTLMSFMLFCTSSVVSGKCLDETYTMNLPQAIDAAKLPDGEHVVASVPTAHGALEARATVKGGKATGGNLFLNGKPLKPILRSKLPAHTRACLSKSRMGVLEERSSRILLSTWDDQARQTPD